MTSIEPASACRHRSAAMTAAVSPMVSWSRTGSMDDRHRQMMIGQRSPASCSGSTSRRVCIGNGRAVSLFGSSMMRGAVWMLTSMPSRRRRWCTVIRAPTTFGSQLTGGSDCWTGTKHGSISRSTTCRTSCPDPRQPRAPAIPGPIACLGSRERLDCRARIRPRAPPPARTARDMAADPSPADTVSATYCRFSAWVRSRRPGVVLIDLRDATPLSRLRRTR